MTAQQKVMHKVGNIRDLKEKRITKARVGGRKLLLIRKGGKVYAIGQKCGEGCNSLSDGVLEGFFIRCPWYHEYYDIRTGRSVGPSGGNTSIKVYETRTSETDGGVFVYMDSEE